LILAGRQTDPGLAGPIAELARAAGFPILAEPTSQLRSGSHDRAQVVATYDAIARMRPSSLAPELVVRFGDMPTSKALRLWLADLQECRQIVVDPGYGWHDPSRHAETILRTAPKRLAVGLADRLGPAEADEAWARDWLAADGAAAAAIATELGRLERLSEPGVHAALGSAYRDGELVYTASSMPIRDQEAFLPAGTAEVLFLCNRGANGIDGLISSGIGAAHASGRPTVIVIGDLGLLHDLGGLAALRETSVSTRIVVIENGGGRIFDLLPQAEAMEASEFDRLMTTPRELDLSRVAAVFGVEHRRPQDAGSLLGALATGTGLIEVRGEPATDRELRRRLGDAVERALRVSLAA
jgi:2-succinyl-5-enolpyruvyl-6-hydroxy-3-cyclohexene-1-carboxylate synthase